jgi:hypothetical protein
MPCAFPSARARHGWFVAKDVCEALGLANSRDAIENLDEDEKATVASTDSRPGHVAPPPAPMRPIDARRLVTQIA